ncbi:hypothetical protein ABMC88_01915 [Sulfitobacter sp. HNIBRBA2951]|uniref:hypothetical protein n=1 Tax=Sulfitobacter aquimarinus TaxID=3158557 RepID=UPI0032DF93FD
MRNLLLSLSAIALLSLPFAHRTGAAPVSEELAQFLSLGGELSDLCGDSPLHPSGGCESCRIVEAANLPAPMPDWTLTPSLRDVRAVPALVSLPRVGTYANRPPARAPPFA